MISGVINLQSILLGLLAVSCITNAFLLNRFVKHLRQECSVTLAEELSVLLPFGSDGIGIEWRALRYLLGRKYEALDNKGAIKKGDQARVSFLISFLLLFATIVWILIAQPVRVG